MSNWGDPYPSSTPRQPVVPSSYGQPPQAADAQRQAYGPPVGVPPDRVFHEAQLDAMHRSADRQTRVIRVVLAIVLPVFLVLRGGASGDGIVFGVTVLVVVVAGLVVGGMISRLLTGQRHAAVVAARPGAEVLEVWGARGLHAALRSAGVPTAKVRKSAATSLSMVPSAEGIELWTGRGSTAAVLVAIPWSSVVAIDESRGSITNDGTRPALMLVTSIGQRLLFVLRTRTNGGRVARASELRALVGRLEVLRARSLGR